MKIKFSNFVKLFLAGASLLAVGCTDYGQDIQNLNDRIDDLQTDVIDPLAVDLEAVKADLAAAKTDLQAKIDANKALIDGLTDELATAKSNIKANADAIAAAQGDIDNLEKAVETINGQIDNLDKAVEDLKAQDAVFAKDIADLKTAVANNTAEIAANKQNIADLTKKVDDHLAAYALFVEKVDAKFIALDKEIEALKAKDAQIDEAIKALQDKDLELEGKINALQDAYTLLEGRVSTIEQEFADHLAAFAAVVDRVSKLEAGHDAQQILIEANQQAIKNLQDELAKTNGRVATLEAGLEQQKQALADAKKELQDNIDALDVKLSDYITKNDAAVKANADAIKKLNDDLTALETKLTDLINSVQDALQKQIDAIKGDLSALKGRIQSLVFVPDHVDGAATIHWAEIVNDKQEIVVVEAQSVLKFQVYPAECAAAIKPADLKFVFSDALADTRTNNKVLDVVAVDVVKNKEGVIAVTVNARDFSDDFYYGDKKYAASLVFTTETANIASCYVNLAPATPKAIEVALVPNTGAYSLPYTPAKQKVHILPEHKYVFTIDGKGSNTIEGMLDAGYEIEVTKHDPVYTCSDPSKIDEFVNTPAPDEKKPYLNFVTVELANAKPENVGLIETITYAYTVCGKTVNAVSTVEVTKVEGSIDLKTKITWNYAEDAKSDAGLELTNSIDPAEIVATNLPEGINYKRVIDEGKILIKNGKEQKSIMLNGKEVTSVTVDFLEGNDPSISISNFVWTYEKKPATYVVKYVYDLPSCTITLNATIEIEDRVREKIAVEFVDDTKEIEHATSYVFENSLTDVNDLKEKNPAQKTIFEQIVANKTNVGEMTEADFLKEVLVTKKNGKYVLSNTYNGTVATGDTNLSISAEGVEATVVFSYVDVTTMPGVVKHVYNVTTWYGQEIEIVKNVVLTLPTTYDFKHINEWVTLNGANTYYSKVLAEYDYQPAILSSLYSFNTKKVDMESAFDVVHGDVTYKTAADAEAANIFQEFILTPTQKDYNILKSEFNGLKLDYMDYDRIFVNVTGKLYLDVLVGTSSEKKELATSFNEGGLYYNYYVQRFEFDNAFTVSNATLYLDNAVTYEVDILSRVKLTDNRPNAEGVYSLLQYTVDDHIATTDNVTYYDRDKALEAIAADPNLNIADVRATFTKGDGKNGFADGMDADKVYMPFHVVTELDINSVPVGLRTADQMHLDESKLKYDTNTHRLTIDGSAQLNLTGKVELEFTVKLMYDDVVYKHKPLTLTIKPLQSPVQPQP